MKSGLFMIIVYLIQISSPLTLSNILAGSKWSLLSVSAPESIQFADTICRATLSFDGNGQYGGYSGCNAFGGKYSVNENGQLKMDIATETKRGCTHPCNFGEDVLGLFPNINMYILNADTLILITTDSIKIFYKKQ
jgi:heat shock protein HslJ